MPVDIYSPAAQLKALELMPREFCTISSALTLAR